MLRIGLIITALVAIGAPTAQAASSTRTVKLLQDAPVYSNPDQTGKPDTTVKATRPLTGAPTVLPVIATVNTENGKWYRVRLPKRPNSDTGWIAGSATQVGSTPWKVTVNRKTRVATVTKGHKTVRRFRVVVGAKRTPTPAGSFFVAEVVRQPHRADTGPYALATSAYSNVLQEFAGGPGQIALHGRTGLSDPLGTAASHGCVRFSDKAIVWMAQRVTAGTPIVIR